MNKTIPFQHQIEDTARLVKEPAFALFSEMGTGKSKIVIDAACILAKQGKIDTVVVVAPASVRCVWVDFEIGEIKKHSWVNNHVFEFHNKSKLIWGDRLKPDDTELMWCVTNYEFLRSEKHLADLCVMLLKRNILLVLDESSYIKNRNAAQTKAVAKLRKHCARCVLLNGTPVTNSPLDLWSQMEVLSPKILKDFHNFYNFRSHYCEMRLMRFGAGHAFQQAVSYRRLDHLAKKLAPWVLRREKKDCLDLPEKLYTEREVALTAESWKRYQELKKDCLIHLNAPSAMNPAADDSYRIEPNAAVRIMRLAQLTSGYLGGITSNDPKKVDFESCWEDLSDEKLRWAVQYLTEESTAKAVIVWCRWRRERERLYEILEGMNEVCPLQIYGGQKQSERNEAVKWFSESRENYEQRIALIAQPHAGGFGLNLVAASEAIYLSNDFSLGIRLQSEDRCHRLGQTNRVLYMDVLATGPAGQKTVDHVIVKALREKKDIAAMTCAEWRKELEDEP
jgi:SNF2 family DNA or RNA helicase